MTAALSALPTPPDTVAAATRSPHPTTADPTTAGLPARFEAWFASRGWQPHPHQRAMVTAARQGRSALLIAPTGGGKTLAGFLPSLIDLAAPATGDGPGLHTLYVSPLKALAVDIRRNLTTPIADLGLDIAVETRTGDTPAGKRQRQRQRPPQILLTTPESLALLLSYTDAPRLFAGLRCIVVDEVHALVGSKRGDLLALAIARLSRLAMGGLRRVGLSATVADDSALLGWLSPTGRPDPATVDLVRGAGAPDARVDILASEARVPWAGHMAVHALPEVYDRIRRAGTTLVFVNTRAQAEIVFQELWRLNDDTLPIGLHHGSLAAGQRRKVEAAMAAGRLRAVVATSSLDLGIDWGAVDLVIQIGAPKGASRLIQRIGRANHRFNEPSHAVLVPGNRFEVLECRAALAAVQAGSLDGDTARPGGLDVLAQHLLGMACCRSFEPDALYDEVRTAAPYADLTRPDFDAVLAFVGDGGYALAAYDRFRRLVPGDDGLVRVPNGRVVRQYRMNAGVIVDAPTLTVRLRRGRALGEVEDYFVQGLVAGDSFVFSGELLRFEELRDNTVIVSRAAAGEAPKVPAYVGGRLPLSTHLAGRVRGILADPGGWHDLPAPVRAWLRQQQQRSVLPPADGLLVETFPRGNRHYLVAYCFEGRNAHQTLGMLLTRRMERAGLGPLGFVATDYVLGVWGLRPATRDGDTGLAALFDQDMLGDDLEAWMAESSLLKRTFRTVAVIAGLIERRPAGRAMSDKQVSINADLIYDVLRRHQPDHILLRATRADAAHGLTDIGRLSAMLGRIQDRIVHRQLDRVSPLAVPVLLEIGREQVYGTAIDDLLDDAADPIAADLIAEATAGVDAAAVPP